MTAEQYYNQQMLPEISEFQKEVYDKVKSDIRIQELYCGWKVWFSQITDNPEILFIGINPGGGEEDRLTLEPDGELQYLYDKSLNFHLKNDTMEVFDGLPNFDLWNCVKINYYYLATKSSDQITTIADLLGRQADKNGIGDRLFSLSRKWTLEMINILKPKIIVCEGIESFNLLTQFVLGTKINSSHLDVIKIYNDQINAQIIGYRRKRGGGILNKNLLQDVLSKI